MAISSAVKRKLWASSGGYCCKPDCNKELFSFSDNGKILNIEELAHIIGQKKNGPRGNSELPLEERDEFDNIILLCPTCHTLIDKNPIFYNDILIKKWKEEHTNKLTNLFKTPVFSIRDDVHKFLYPLLTENKIIFDTYGPYSKNAKEYQYNTELIWEKIAFEKIIPNNRKIESIIEQNQHLFVGNEFGLFIEYKLHREGFEYNKISGDVNSIVPKFPNGIENIFK